MDEVDRIIKAIGDDMQARGWSMWNEWGGEYPGDGTFAAVVKKHLEPALEPGYFRTARIAGLEAELAALKENGR